MQKDHEEFNIGVLDIYGFEIFQVGINHLYRVKCWRNNENAVKWAGYCIPLIYVTYSKMDSSSSA